MDDDAQTNGLVPKVCAFCKEEGTMQIDNERVEGGECVNCRAPTFEVAVDFSCSNCHAYGSAGGLFHGPDGTTSPVEQMRRNAHLN